MEGPTAATFDHLLTFFFFFQYPNSPKLKKKKREKVTPTDMYGPTNSVKNIE